jgi:predicted secreted protein
MALKAQQSIISVLVAGVLHDIEEVVNITGPDGKAKLIDTTHLKSTGKEYLQGLADWGAISMDCNFTGETYQMYLRTMYATQAPANTFRVKIPDDTSGEFHVFTFEGIVTSWNLDVKTDDKVDLKISLQVSGSVDYAPPGGSPAGP